MTQYSRKFRYSADRAAHISRKFIAPALAISTLAALGACSSTSNLSKERVASSESSVRQSQQTLGQSEHGAVELQQAKEKLSAAQSALAKGQEKEAERLATQARLYAELAVAKSQSAHARKGADEVLTGLNMLRDETERATPAQR